MNTLEKQASHTPGPWTALPKMAHQDFIEVVHLSTEKGAASRVVARVTCRQGWLMEQHANAELVMAAPDLLGALKGLHDDIAEYARINQLGGWDNHWMRAARAAIEKATGSAHTN